MGWSKAYLNYWVNWFHNPDKFRAVALAAGSNVTLLAEQVKIFKPQLFSVMHESLVDELKEALADLDEKPEIIPGEQGVIEVARHPDAASVVTGIVGCAGLKITRLCQDAENMALLSTLLNMNSAQRPKVLSLEDKLNVLGCKDLKRRTVDAEMELTLAKSPVSLRPNFRKVDLFRNRSFLRSLKFILDFGSHMKQNVFRGSWISLDSVF